MNTTTQKKRWFSMLAAGQILLMLNILSNTFIDRTAKYDQLQVIGIFFFVLVLIFWPIPVLYLRKHGQVSSSGSFMATTRLVKTGLYRIIRHPQYLGFVFLNVGLALLNQDFLTISLSLSSASFILAGIKEEEELLLNQFGEELSEYKRQVPSVNLFVGLFRLMK